MKLTDSRLDVIFKREYAWAFKNEVAPKNSWYYDFYKEHIRAINDFSESNNNKKKFSDFLDTFHRLINEFENDNWDITREKIELSSDGSIRNGGHRLALSNLYNKKFCEVILTNKKPLDYSLEFFQIYGFFFEVTQKHIENNEYVLIHPEMQKKNFRPNFAAVLYNFVQYGTVQYRIPPHTQK